MSMECIFRIILLFMIAMLMLAGLLISVPMSG
jgi:hypothetical protein